MTAAKRKSYLQTKEFELSLSCLDALDWCTCMLEHISKTMVCWVVMDARDTWRAFVEIGTLLGLLGVATSQGKRKQSIVS